MSRVPRTVRAVVVPVLVAAALASCRGGGDGERAVSTLAERPVLTASVPDVIAHRGASGHRPEHTLAAYRLAIRQGADHIEPDVVSTKDGVLVVRHENELGRSTDVAKRPEFAGRRTTKRVGGKRVTGWFTEDFTLAELHRLRAREPSPHERPDSAAYDGRFRVPTLDEVVGLAREESRRLGREIGVLPETKHPAYFDSIGLSLEPPLAATLRRHGLDDADGPAAVQSLDPRSLRELDAQVETPLLKLVGVDEGAALARPRRLARIASYADGVAVAKDVVTSGAVGERIVDGAHARDLDVHVWTVRAEDPGDLGREVRTLEEVGVDGIFTDHPDLVVAALAH